MVPPRRLPSALSASLNLLRALAAGLVVTQHVRVLALTNWEDLSPGDHGGLAAAGYFVTSMGHVAVVIFFVMSGYLVGGGLLVDLKHDAVSLLRYFTNRLARIYTVLLPALFIGYAMDVVSMDWLHSNLASDTLQIQAPRLTVLLGNIASLQTIVVPPLGTNLALWSLANEIWYYVLWPLVVIPFTSGRSRWVRALCAVAAAAVGMLLYPTILAWFPLWCLGALVRVAPRPLMRRVPTAVCLALVAILCNRLGRATLSGWPGDLVTSLGIANLLWTVQARPDLPAPPGASLWATFAEFSFSLYATHLPIIVLVATGYSAVSHLRPHGRPSLLTLSLSAGLVLVAYLFAWAFYLTTERQTTAVRNALQRLERAARSSIGALRSDQE